MKNLRVDVIKNIDDKFLGKWQGLWEKSWNAHLFNSPRWLVTVISAFGIKETLVLACYKENELIALCPLVYSNRFGVRVLTSPGGKYSDKSPLLLRQKDEDILSFFLSKIFSFGNVYLPEIEEWTLGALGKRNYHVLVDGPFVSPFIPKEPGLLSFLNKRQSRKIKNENLKNKHDLRFQTFFREVNKISEIVFAIEGESSRRAQGKGSFTDDNLTRLFNSVMKFWPNEVSLDVMFFKDKPVCYMLGILDSDTFYALNTAYIEGYQNLIPGKMVVYYLLERLQGLEVELFDFLRGTSRFKQDFTPFFSEQFDVYYSKNILYRVWWTLLINFTDSFKESGIFYKIYLTFKKQALSFPQQLKLAHT